MSEIKRDENEISSEIKRGKNEKKEVNRFRKNQMHFCVTDEEKEIIEKRKNSLGLKSMGTYLRKVALTGECKVYNFTPIYKQLKEMNFYISSISKSVNQIAKRVNSTGNIYDEDIESIRSMIKTIFERQVIFMKACMRKDDKD